MRFVRTVGRKEAFKKIAAEQDPLPTILSREVRKAFLKKRSQNPRQCLRKQRARFKFFALQDLILVYVPVEV